MTSSHFPARKSGTATRRSSTVLISPATSRARCMRTLLNGVRVRRVSLFDSLPGGAAVRNGRFGIADDLVDLVVLDVARMRENDQLAQQAEREELHSQHHE